MSFTSLSFLFYFLPLSLLLYSLCPKRLKKGLLIVISVLFYGWMKPINMLYLILLIFYVYLGGRFIQSTKEQGLKRIRMWCLCSFLIFLLVYFKYAQGLYDAIVSMLSLKLQIDALLMPLGSSFILFQALSYLFDIGYEKTDHVKLIDCALYISFFPKLLMGPIMQYHDFIIKNEAAFVTWDSVEAGTRRFTLGLAQKVILADSMAQLYAVLNTDTSTLGCWLASIAYTFQIFFDFAGYTSMAIGTAMMLGYRLNENFCHPYHAQSIRDFWRRWHISLSTWFRDYVYIPLGGNRVSVWKHIRNVLIVWMLTGMWHGNSFNFILWGFYYACLLLLETYSPLKHMAKLKVISQLITFLLVNFGWIIFAESDITALGLRLSAMLGFGSTLCSAQSIAYLCSYAGLLSIGAVLVFLPIAKWKQMLTERCHSEWLPVIAYACLFFISIAFLLASQYQSFLYFRF